MKGISSVSLAACDEHCDCIVAYGGGKCPLCVAEKEKEDLEQEVCDLEQEVGALQQNISD